MTNWKYVPIASIVPIQALHRSEAFNLDEYVFDSEVRGLRIRWLAPSKRLLWMAAGSEYIEPELLDWIDQIPKGCTYYDIGASNGIYALYAAKRGLNVVALEPDPANFFLLSWNVFLNQDAQMQISPLNVAASDRFAINNLLIHKMELGGHKKIVSTFEADPAKPFEHEYSQPIQLVHLDKWVEQMELPRPEYIKIDIDGHEFQMLTGAQNIVSKCRQVFIEIEDVKLNELDKILNEMGFVMVNKYTVQNYKGLWNCVYCRNT